MIVGKNSALIGFGLFFIIIVVLTTSIFAFTTGIVLAVIVGILNIIINGYVYYKIYQYFEKKQ